MFRQYLMVITLVLSLFLSFKTYAVEDYSYEAIILEQKGSEYVVEYTDTSNEKRKVTANTVQTGELQLRNYSVGDKVIISQVQNGDSQEFYITDFVRKLPLTVLFFIFATIAILIGGIKGVRSLLGLLFSYIIILNFILKYIFEGYSPILISIIGALFIMLVTFYLSHGFNKKTTISIIGTFITLFFTGLIAQVFISWSKLSGYGSDDSIFLQILKQDSLDMSGLLLAGVIISTLGVLDDITTSQVSIVNELLSANPRMDSVELFLRAMNVGKDHIASLVNTLFLVFTGGSLPLLLLFFDSSKTLSDIINYEFIAQEVLVTLVGSIGLILAVPITTIIASVSLKNKL